MPLGLPPGRNAGVRVGVCCLLFSTRRTRRVTLTIWCKLICSVEIERVKRMSGTEANGGGTGSSFDFKSMFGPLSKGLPFVGDILGGIGSFQAAQGMKVQAQQMERSGMQALEQGFQTSFDLQREGTAVLGEMTVAFGKSGTLLEGSPLLALADTQSQIERNVGRAIEQGRIEKAAFDAQAKALRKQASQAKIAGVAGIVGGFGDLLKPPPKAAGA